MRKLWWRRLIVVFLIAILQTAFFAILFPHQTIPILILGTVGAIVLTRGFRKGMPAWLGLLFLSDLLAAGSLTLLLPLGIIFAYGVSFLSRRFVLEHRGLGVFASAGAVATLGAVYGLGVWYFSGAPPMLWNVATDTLFLFFLFFPLFEIIRRFEHRLDTLSQAEFRGLRYA